MTKNPVKKPRRRYAYPKLTNAEHPDELKCWLCWKAKRVNWYFGLEKLKFHLKHEHRWPWTNEMERELTKELELQDSRWRLMKRPPFYNSIFNMLRSKWSAPDESELIERLKGNE